MAVGPPTRAEVAHAARRLGTVAGAGFLAVLVASGAAVAVSAIARPTFLGGVSGLPAWATGPLAPLALHPTGPQLYLALGVMSAAYLGVLVLGTRLRARWIVGAIVALDAVFLLAPPLLSADVFNYVDYARLGALHHLDPYTAVPAAVPSDPVYPFVHWRATRSAYGPLFTLASYPLAWLGPGGAVWAFKGLAAAAGLGCVALVWRLAVRLERPVVPAVATFGLNPVVLVWTVGGAHNDLWMVLAMLAGFALVLKAREVRGGLALAAAVAIKVSAGLAIPFVVLGARRRWWRVVAGAAMGLGLAVAVAFVAFPDHAVGLIAVLRHEQGLVALDSLPFEVAQLFGLPGLTSPAATVSAVLLGVALAVLLLRTWRGRDWLGASGWAFVAVIAASSWFLGWYTVWALPAAALVRDRRLLVATLGLQAVYVVNHVPLW